MTGRRGVAAITVAGLFLPAIAIFVSGSARAASADGPIVIFLVDTLRRDRVSVYGAPRSTTPAAESLAREGIVFENAYSLSSWTRASVATLFTSRLPAAAGALDRKGRLGPSVVTLPQLLRDHGWKTAAFVANTNVSHSTGFSRGFDVFESVRGPSPALEADPRAAEVVDRAVRFLSSQVSPRFLLYVHVMEPHLPLDLDPEHRSLFAREGGNESDPFLDYDRAIRQADDQFARIAAALRAKGFWDGATVVYTADHGEEFHEHGRRGHGDTLYEEQIRIPLVVKPPAGRIAPGRRQDLVSLADVLPTLAGLYGLPGEASWIGSGLLAPLPERSLYFTEDFEDNRLYALRKGTKKVVARLYPKLDEEVFDLSSDPGEAHGRPVACGAPVPGDAQALFAELTTLRSLDVSFFPRIEFEKVTSGSLRLILFMALVTPPRPFLTPDASCRYQTYVRGRVLSLVTEVPADEVFRVSIAGDVGEIPLHRLTVFDARGNEISGAQREKLLRTVRFEYPGTRSSESEDEVRALRNLGYLGGKAGGAGKDR
ncbi:MAG: sulfatase [Thermoanaerobaculia bacterium]